MNNILTALNEYKFDHAKIVKDVYSIIDEHNGIPQIGLTHSPKPITDMEKILESTGSIFDYEKNEYKFKETDFKIFNEKYKNTYLYEIYKSIPNLGRFRIMTLYGPKCYSIHRDLSKRYHYVIETNPNCLFLFPDFNLQLHMPVDNKLYIADTTHRHTFLNGGWTRRIHLVLDDLTTLKQ